MSTPEAREHVIRLRMQQADESIDEAKAMLDRNSHRAAINRAYYGMFYAVQALIVSKSKRFSKHSGAISMFDLEFIKPGTLAREYSKWLHDAFELRMQVDYGELAQPDHDQAQETLIHAEDFVNQVKQFLASNPA